MSALFAELDYRPTPIGPISLRRRRELKLGVDIFEIKLGEEFLMSSLFTASEIALARLGIAALVGTDHDILVGGLGLGYTACEVLRHDTVGSLLVVEFLDPVIEWHRTGLLPNGATMEADRRCRIVSGDFFAGAASAAGFDPEREARRFDAILLDIDHSPEALLDARSTSFYHPDGLAALGAHLKPNGIFALWSDALPDDSFVERLADVFAEAWVEPVTFHNPLQDRPFTQSVYLARKAAGSSAAA
ncbi:hypothetical protein [Afifella marina]|uniref:Spermine/spermidine synthase n=1 Tax=Afifella marina DSM 2698 TaxID=1120955 RepID=A0A1G5MCX5_AFIMA|nr:hypothetical protein [Afifella marina]MBK1622661.1 spermidine synthase [Afifella marina DSM 2698]MBK1625656.1 spermidine synthase [Afifella marina]MBK5917479.1 spermidine synthase [Afifella marina]RAI23721.1 spermidine synthase [Afifella marina DSM 2698]SCZ22581.1 Spermine/spermidine synthase [Afifella marina DSM 2698]